MPIYEFKCDSCGNIFTKLFKSITVDASELTCPKCGSKKVKKMISAFSSPVTGSTGGSGSCGGSGFS